jgi:hypothetical protein
MLALFILWLANVITTFAGIPRIVQGLGLVGAHQLELIATILGVFFYGKRYWR